ncbi:uncharacterized protein LOC129224688 [Uloborus diversus]|uniref:uncharacterized protein LOC129224688 n=1 Tax=Uloborus diversus TaxID=327109 RepID=UPI00240A3FA0|nr:uncharacterized protein LOC129224688 [Uloborus diversus]
MSLVAVLTVFAVLSCLDARAIKSTPSSICSAMTPCGWEVYKPYVRTVEFFMKSPCDCPSDQRCVRYSDDISISAYVHRCSPSADDSNHLTGESNSSPFE